MSDVRTTGRRVGSVDEITQPGDYYLNPDSGDGLPSLWFWLPRDDPHRFTGRPQLNRITQPPWVFRECDDGSVEVRESIRTHEPTAAAPTFWHGYLDEGHVWREVDV